MSKHEKMFEKVAVRLEDPEVLKLGKELAEKRVAYNALAEEKGEALKTFNAKLNTMDAQIDDLARQVSERVTERDIEIIEEHDDARKMVIIKNAETGAILRTRKMTIEEMGSANARAQGGLPFGDSDDDEEDAEDDSDAVSDTDPPPPELVADDGEQKLVQLHRGRRSRVAAE